MANSDNYRVNCPRCDRTAISWDWQFPVWSAKLVVVKGRCNACHQPVQREYEFVGCRDLETDELFFKP